MLYQTYRARRPPKGPKNAIYVPGDLDLWPWPSNFRARDQLRLPCEFGANPFSGFRDISYANKKHWLTAPKTEPSTLDCVRKLLKYCSALWWLLLPLLHAPTARYQTRQNRKQYELECGPMLSVMAALPNIGGALCSTPQSLADAHY